MNRRDFRKYATASILAMESHTGFFGRRPKLAEVQSALLDTWEEANRPKLLSPFDAAMNPQFGDSIRIGVTELDGLSTIHFPDGSSETKPVRNGISEPFDCTLKAGETYETSFSRKITK